MSRWFHTGALFVAIGGLAALPVFAQTAWLANPGFEEGQPNTVPTGWSASRQGPAAAKPESSAAEVGFAKRVSRGCRTGAGCVMLTSAARSASDPAGSILQSIPAARFNRIRLSAAIRVEGDRTRVQMWLRFEKADGSTARLESPAAASVTSRPWHWQKLDSYVEPGSTRIVVGFSLFGAGAAWIDDTDLSRFTLAGVKPDLPRPLSDRGLKNLTAFTRLFGYVRHFHPSDQAGGADWETFAVDGVSKVESAASDTELATQLREVFAPVAPTVAVYLSGQTPPAIELGTGPYIIRWEHEGVGFSPYAVYRSTRGWAPAKRDEPPAIFEAELAPGILTRVPLALYADHRGTLPHAAVAVTQPLSYPEARNRAVRLAAVIIAWNVFQHFYPYFDVVKTDWSLELTKALRAGANDKGPSDFERTLLRLVAALKDGHGYVYKLPYRPPLFPPVAMDWVQDELVVAGVLEGAPEGIARGDRVLAIDGKPIGQAITENRELISAASEGWMRRDLKSRLSYCDAETRRMKVEVEPLSQPSVKRVVELACSTVVPWDKEYYPARRPPLMELSPGVWYVDLRRVQEADWKGALSGLEVAQGIVFDMRGKPTDYATTVLRHLMLETMQMAQMLVPTPARPDRIGTDFQQRDRWNLAPLRPHLKAQRAFLTDSTAISYAESLMGIVEHYKLGEIVGSPTAGTNGNINPFGVPGGYSISWTGMKVLKHDGSQHHGVGILPTIPAARTRAGVAAGKDEVLERALELFR